MGNTPNSTTISPRSFSQEKAFHWYLHTDGYAGYNKVAGITRYGCWSHLRRKFVDAMPPELAQLAGPPSTAQVGRDYCDQLFAAEKKIQMLPGENWQEKRLEIEQPMLRAFWCWLEKVAEHPLGGKQNCCGIRPEAVPLPGELFERCLLPDF